MQQHVRDHVGDFVAMRTFMQATARCGSQPLRRPGRLATSRWRLYVDPRTGLLRKNKHYETWSKKYREMRAAAEKHRATRMREIAPNVQVHKLDDNCWWEVRLAPIPTRS